MDTDIAAAAAGQRVDGALSPVASSERISSLDFIRGLAVMGILAANIVAFGQPMSAYIYPGAFLTDADDPGGWLWIAQFVLIDGKMRGLFAILFGAGMVLFMQRAWSRGSTRWLQFWRLAILFAFGMLHFIFLFYGDILYLYALHGCLALAFMRLSADFQLRLGLFLYFCGAVLFGGGMLLSYLTLENPMGNFADIAPAEAALAQLQLSGDYPAYVAQRMSEQWALPLIMPLMTLLEVFPLILIGMALFRLGFFTGEFDRTKMRFWGWAGVIGGGAATVALALYVKSTGFSHAATNVAFIGWSTLPRLAMTLGLAALLAVWAPSMAGWLGDRVRAAGRAAFTNYLGTSVLMLFVFHGWALGLFGALNRPQLYLVVILTWLVMLGWSKPWLDRYRYGPLEWAWRCLTYRRVFPLRR